MLDWLSETFFSLMHAILAVFTEPSSPNFFLARTMIGLIVIALVAYLLVFFRDRSMLSRIRQSLTSWLRSSRD